jgi:glycosyltransferase involved in cell wall biosynthesis
MRILHVTPTYLPARRYGGPIFAVHGLCKSLVDSGHEVHVFTTNIDGKEESNVPLDQPVDLDGVKVWYFQSKFLRKLFFSPKMKRRLRKEAGFFNLLHIHSLFVWPTLMAARFANSKGIPYVLSPHGMLNPTLIHKKNRWVKLAWISLFDRWNMKRASGIHYTSALENNEAEGFAGKLPAAFVVPFGIDLATDENKATNVVGPIELALNNEYILFLGRVHWKKGLDRLIRAMSYVHHAELIIAGNDEDNFGAELRKIAHEHGLNSRIKFIGPVYGAEKKILYEKASIFVLSSYSENFAMTVLEAMAAGCPVIVTPEVGLADSLIESGAGIVTHGDPKKLAVSINGLLADRELRRQMGEVGRRTAMEQFAWDKIARQMTAVYERILKRVEPNLISMPPK